MYLWWTANTQRQMAEKVAINQGTLLCCWFIHTINNTKWRITEMAIYAIYWPFSITEHCIYMVRNMIFADSCCCFYGQINVMNPFFSRYLTDTHSNRAARTPMHDSIEWTWAFGWNDGVCLQWQGFFDFGRLFFISLLFIFLLLKFCCTQFAEYLFYSFQLLRQAKIVFMCIFFLTFIIVFVPKKLVKSNYGATIKQPFEIGSH